MKTFMILFCLGTLLSFSSFDNSYTVEEINNIKITKNHYSKNNHQYIKISMENISKEPISLFSIVGETRRGFQYHCYEEKGLALFRQYGHVFSFDIKGFIKPKSKKVFVCKFMTEIKDSLVSNISII